MRILFVQPTLNPPGGGELVAAWMVQALAGEHDVTLLALEEPCFEDCDRHFGTSLSRCRIPVRTLPGSFREAIARSPWRLDRLRDALLTRTCLAMAGDFDLVVTANSEMDLGGHGVQYLHYPKEGLFLPVEGGSVAKRIAARLYRAACDRIAGDRVDRIRSNVTLVNSDWTGRWVRRVHPIETRTVYPPVPGRFRDVVWDEREDSVVALGRLVREKRFEEVVAIVDGVRAAGRDLRLTLLAWAGTDPGYAEEIRRLVAENAPWVTLHEGPAKQDVEATLPRHRFALHAMRDEHFGIAVAETLRAGCIPLVPRSGGPAEIVGEEEALLFDTSDDAVRLLGRLVEDRGLCEGLRTRLAARARLFSTERFVSEVLDSVADAPRPAGRRR